MDILTNLQEYGVIGAASTIVLMILKYNGKQGWKESLGLSDREKFFSSLAWMCLVMYYQYYNRNFILGREHGSAEWADP